MRVAKKGVLGALPFAAFVALGCSSPGPLPMADAGRPAWRNEVGEALAVLSTDHLLLRFTRDGEARVVGVLGIEGPFDRNPAGKLPRDFFSVAGVRGGGWMDQSPWPTGGRLAWAHSFDYSEDGHLKAEIDCLGRVTTFKPGLDAAIDLERGTALAEHTHRGESQLRDGLGAAELRPGISDRLRTDSDPFWRLFGVQVGPHTYVFGDGGVRTQSRR